MGRREFAGEVDGPHDVPESAAKIDDGGVDQARAKGAPRTPGRFGRG
jgi:hypothetical protein